MCFPSHSTLSQPICGRIAATAWDAAAKIPNTPQHAGGDVEQAAAVPETDIREAEQRGGFLVYGHCRLSRLAVDAADDAVFAVARVTRLDALDLGDGFVGCPVRGLCIGCVELKLVLAGHCLESETIKYHPESGD